MRILEKKVNEGVKENIEFFNSIKKELENKLKKLTGIQFNIKAFPSRSKDTLLIKDDTNVISKIGAFGACLEEIYISGDCWFNDGAKELNGSLDFTYTSKSGGSNGLTLIKFYFEDNELTVQDASKKYI